MEAVTLEEARIALMEGLDDGVLCPCCGQNAKRYRRKFLASLGACCVILARLEREVQSGRRVPDNILCRHPNWFHIPTVVQRYNPSKANQGGYAGSLAEYWGLIRGDKGVREDGSSRTGWYQLTERGREFVGGRLSIPKYAVTFNAQVLRLEGDSIGIVEALGQKFHYDELMEGV